MGSPSPPPNARRCRPVPPGRAPQPVILSDAPCGFCLIQTTAPRSLWKLPGRGAQAGSSHTDTGPQPGRGRRCTRVWHWADLRPRVHSRVTTLRETVPRTPRPPLAAGPGTQRAPAERGPPRVPAWGGGPDAAVRTQDWLACCWAPAAPALRGRSRSRAEGRRSRVLPFALSRGRGPCGGTAGAPALSPVSSVPLGTSCLPCPRGSALCPLCDGAETPEQHGRERETRQQPRPERGSVPRGWLTRFHPVPTAVLCRAPGAPAACHLPGRGTFHVRPGTAASPPFASGKGCRPGRPHRPPSERRPRRTRGCSPGVGGPPGRSWAPQVRLSGCVHDAVPRSLSVPRPPRPRVPASPQALPPVPGTTRRFPAVHPGDLEGRGPSGGTRAAAQRPGLSGRRAGQPGPSEVPGDLESEGRGAAHQPPEDLWGSAAVGAPATAQGAARPAYPAPESSGGPLWVPRVEGSWAVLCSSFWGSRRRVGRTRPASPAPVVRRRRVV